ncbi:hypothetical protein AVEN_80336-1 [Araneus ventricosus]|uniref:Uncharacterized protein n=1 Tax=Araneus ventricosus TaxID=182803 RepID=A0A4Y2VG93_ARAVE|nr:hypothetical protein AVEN_270432-1 [Araneus ventricosus]GBO23498.1 hypothetical protein AVEN_80336-1 [Araneus ventricosus]
MALMQKSFEFIRYCVILPEAVQRPSYASAFWGQSLALEEMPEDSCPERLGWPCGPFSAGGVASTHWSSSGPTPFWVRWPSVRIQKPPGRIEGASFPARYSNVEELSYLHPNDRKYLLWEELGCGRPSVNVSATELKGLKVRNPIPLKIRRVWDLLHVKLYVMANVLTLVCCGSLERRMSSQMSSSSSDRGSNYEVRPKIALVLLQNGTLIFN